MGRINKYLSADEIDESAISHDESIKTPIIMESCTFSWNNNEAPTLKNISVQIKKKKLVAIVGMVGSGKSSFLSSLLGDMLKIKGTVNVNVINKYLKINCLSNNNI